MIEILGGLFAALGAGLSWRPRRGRQAATVARTALWDYQRVLNDLGRECAALLLGTADPLSETTRDDLYRVRELAYPHIGMLSPEAQWVLLAPSLPDLANPALGLIDIAHAYLRMAAVLRGDLETPLIPPATGPVLVVRDVSAGRERS